MYVKITFIMLNVHNYVCGSRGGTTGAVQLKQLASDYSQQKHTTWADNYS